MSQYLPITPDEIIADALGAAEAGAAILHLHAHNPENGKPEVASLNMASINFALFHLLDKYKEFKFDWEKPHLEATRDLVFRNSFKDIEFILKTCYENNTRFEFECYDIAHIYNLAHFAERGLVKPPFFVQSVFGSIGPIRRTFST